MGDVIKSILQHGVVGLVAGLGLFLTNWVAINPDPHSWTLMAFAGGMFTMVVAVIKKLVTGELIGALPFFKK